MDLVDLFPLIIFAALYFFGSSKKKEEERAKKRAARESLRSSPTESPSGGESGGLQARLEEALRKMEQRIETESAGGAERFEEREERRAEPVAELDQPTVLEQYEANQESSEIASYEPYDPYDADAVSNEIGRLSAEALYDNDLLDGGVEKMPGHDGFTVALDEGRPERSTAVSEELARQYDFTSLFDEVPNETYHGHGFGTFNVAHGLHYGEEPGTTPLDAEPTDRPVADRRTFRSIDELRRAIIVAEILEKPVSMRKR